MQGGDRPDDDDELSLVDNALLGLIVNEPGNGEDLLWRFRRRFGELLPVDWKTIRASLRRLEDRGLIEPISQPPANDSSDGSGEDE